MPFFVPIVKSGYQGLQSLIEKILRFRHGGVIIKIILFFRKVVTYMQSIVDTHRANELQTITDSVVTKVVDILADKIYKIILYGSYARGDFTAESDVDIIILLNCDKEEVKSFRTEISRLSSRIGLENDIEVSLMLRDRTSYEEGLAVLPFYRNIENEGKVLYG
jgi:predicted nucleotidyltransferase